MARTHWYKDAVFYQVWPRSFKDGNGDGMVHISKLENRRVEKVEDVLNLGDMTWVKFMGFDEKGRANFSRKDALKEMANA